VNNPAMSPSSVEMNGRIAYASQVPFILNGTVRENILFGLPYHRDLYERVLDACNLVADLQQLGIAGDLTEIGERGVTLSGGQKARVALARCVYSQSDIVLLDDILSALDAATGKTIFDTLLDSTGPSNGLLKNSAVILVTHSTHFLSRMDNILVLSKGNSIFYGSWKELLEFTPPDASSSEAIESIVSSLQEAKSSSDNCSEDGAEVKQRNNYDSEKPSKESGRLMTGKPFSGIVTQIYPCSESTLCALILQWKSGTLDYRIGKLG
jgi:ABC-type methionine transport system ATPase subunit